MSVDTLNAAALKIMIDTLFEWKHLSEPLECNGKAITWQRLRVALLNGGDGLEYHTEEEHARWALEKEFSSEGHCFSEKSSAFSPVRWPQPDDVPGSKTS
jgi:hypothetical protein